MKSGSECLENANGRTCSLINAAFVIFRRRVDAPSRAQPLSPRPGHGMAGKIDESGCGSDGLVGFISKTEAEYQEVPAVTAFGDRNELRL